MGDLVGKLVEFRFTSSAETHAFASDVYAKVPRRASGISNYQKQEREAAKLVQKQSTYKLSANEDDNTDNQTPTSQKTSTNPSSKSRKHFRRKADQDSGDDEIVAKDSGRNVRQRTEEEDEEGGDGSSDEENERIRDQQEKAQLERNMRERDAANTRKVIIQLADTSCLVSISFGEQTDYSRRVEKYIPNENTEDHKIKI